MNFSFSFIKFWDNYFRAASNYASLCFNSIVKDSNTFRSWSNLLFISSSDWVRLNVTESCLEDWWAFACFGFEKWVLLGAIWLSDDSSPRLSWLLSNERLFFYFRPSVKTWQSSQIKLISFFHRFWLAFNELFSSSIFLISVSSCLFFYPMASNSLFFLIRTLLSSSISSPTILRFCSYLRISKFF